MTLSMHPRWSSPFVRCNLISAELFVCFVFNASEQFSLERVNFPICAVAHWSMAPRAASPTVAIEDRKIKLLYSFCCFCDLLIFKNQRDGRLFEI